MAFVLDDLVAFGSASGSNLVFAYTSNDTLAVIETANYFDSAGGRVSLGDLIFVQGDLDGTPFAQQYVVSATTASSVEITATTGNAFTSNLIINTEVALTDGATGHVVVPVAGTVTDIQTVLLDGAITTNDAVCTFAINATPITTGVVTIANAGSAIGDVDSATPTGANTVALDDVLICTVSGTPGGSRNARVTFYVTPT